MAYTEQTTHYGLPLPTAGDKSTFLDTNESFERVDSALYGAATDASAAYNKSIEIALESHELKRSVIELSDKIDTMRADVNLNTTNIVATMEDVDTLQTDTNKLKLDVNDLITSTLPNIKTELKKKIDTFSGTVSDEADEQYTAKAADAIAYDETNGQLLLKVDGADTVIPFSKSGGGGGQSKIIGVWAISPNRGVIPKLDETQQSYTLQGWRSAAQNENPVIIMGGLETYYSNDQYKIGYDKPFTITKYIEEGNKPSYYDSTFDESYNKYMAPVDWSSVGSSVVLYIVKEV